MEGKYAHLFPAHHDLLSAGAQIGVILNETRPSNATVVQFIDRVRALFGVRDADSRREANSPEAEAEQKKSYSATCSEDRKRHN